MNHDRARPGANVLQVALERLLRQEVHKANGLHGVTILMDMSMFYDTINLDRLQDKALKLQYPPLLLELAMQDQAVSNLSSASHTKACHLALQVAQNPEA